MERHHCFILGMIVGVVMALTINEIIVKQPLYKMIDCYHKQPIQVCDEVLR